MCVAPRETALGHLEVNERPLICDGVMNSSTFPSIETLAGETDKGVEEIRRHHTACYQSEWITPAPEAHQLGNWESFLLLGHLFISISWFINSIGLPILPLPIIFRIMKDLWGSVLVWASILSWIKRASVLEAFWVPVTSFGSLFESWFLSGARSRATCN